MVGRGQVDGNAGRNILRTGDYQYAPDTASPFFLVERKRNEVPETDRGETSRFRVRVPLLLASAFKLENFSNVLARVWRPREIDYVLHFHANRAKL